MTSLLERTISIIAPHHCFSCSKESNILCVACASQVFGNAPEVCALCNRPTADARVCKGCAPKTALRHVWVASEYDGVVKRLIRAYKFDRVRAAYKPLADGMLEALPYLGSDIIVVYVPTAPVRVRQRGYDQARLLAREIARLQGWQHRSLLLRRHNDRQVGASRAQRLRQAQTAFTYSGGTLDGARVLLVDDVTTSGATLAAAAQVLADAGAVCVDAVVAAKHTLE